MTLPTFFVIGAAKAGTTSLHHYLGLHPEIQMSATKEPNFFAGPENGLPYPPGRIDRLDAYERLFDPRVAVRGEASTDYAASPRREGVPERIKALVPDAKLVYLVRDPIARTISHYQMRVAFLGERRTLRAALGDLSDRRCPYLCAGFYATQIELYLHHFPHESVLVVDQADLLAKRRETLAEVFAFLGVDATLDSERFDEQLLDNRGWRAYPPGYARFVDRVVSPAVRWLPGGLRRSLRRTVEGALWSPLPSPELGAELRAGLQALYADEVARLRTLTGKDFPTWSM